MIATLHQSCFGSETPFPLKCHPYPASENRLPSDKEHFQVSSFILITFLCLFRSSQQLTLNYRLSLIFSFGLQIIYFFPIQDHFSLAGTIFGFSLPKIYSWPGQDVSRLKSQHASFGSVFSLS